MVDQQYIADFSAAHKFATDHASLDFPEAEAYAHWYAAAPEHDSLHTAFDAWTTRAKYRP